MRAKKSLGQNWLRSDVAVKKIVAAGNLGSKDLVLEIGPGQGVLTEILLDQAGKVIAIEKDRRLIVGLEEKFSQEIAAGKLDLQESDVLDFSPKAIGKYKLIANIPYYITGQIIRKFLEAKNKPRQIVILVQKEVAERVVGRGGKESILSLAVKFFGQPKIAGRVSRTAFRPAPKVDSAILVIDNITNQNEKTVPSEKFFALVHRGFAHPRKTLKNNLGEDSWRLAKCAITPETRPENLSLNDWLCLASAQ